MDFKETFYPGLWCMIFMMCGLLILIIKVTFGSDEPVLMYAYYGFGVATLIALCFLVMNVAKSVADEQ
jgi:hypothetical protein